MDQYKHTIKTHILALAIAAGALWPSTYAIEADGRAIREDIEARTDSLPADEPRYAVTDFSVNFMRENPDFPEELGNQILMGTPVKVIGQESYWKKIVSPDPYTAWCVEMGLVEMTGRQLEDYIAAPKYIVTAEYSHVYAQASEKSGRISDLVMGDLLRIALKSGQHASGSPRGISRNGYAKVLMPSGVEGFVKKSDIQEFSHWAATREATPENIVKTAMLFLGIPYQWGGTSVKGVDCSGFTRMVWFMNGVLLPRNASQQDSTGEKIAYPGKGKGSVNQEEMLEFTSRLMPGDLLFFGKGERASHVGIYIGGGRFIHASQKVRISSLIPSEADYYALSMNLQHACRVIGQEDKGTGVVSMTESPAYFPQSE